MKTRLLFTTALAVLVLAGSAAEAYPWQWDSPLYVLEDSGDISITTVDANAPLVAVNQHEVPSRRFVLTGYYDEDNTLVFASGVAPVCWTVL
jgi:hypothetical protein